MRLIICGNGFDLHHRLPTAFSDYRHFLDKFNPDVVDGIIGSNYFAGKVDEESFWTDVEANLVFAYDQMLEESIDGYSPNPAAEDFRDRDWHAMEFDSEEKVRNIDDTFTTTALAEWIRSIDIFQVKEMPKVSLKTDDVFVTFNYTKTLEKVYGIPNQQILHIHGCIDDSSPLQFGNPTQTPNKIKSQLEQIHGDNDYYGMSIEPAAENYAAVARNFSKDLEANLPTLDSFINGKSIDEVIIMGHSYLGVDKYYYDNVFVPRYQSAKWTIYCRDIGDVKRAFEFFTERNLDGKVKIWYEKGCLLRRLKAGLYGFFKEMCK